MSTLKLDGREFRKVRLPGETPWAEVLQDFDDGTFLGRIDNTPACPDLHDYKKDQVLRFSLQWPGNRAEWGPK